MLQVDCGHSTISVKFCDHYFKLLVTITSFTGIMNTETSFLAFWCSVFSTHKTHKSSRKSPTWLCFTKVILMDLIMFWHFCHHQFFVTLSGCQYNFVKQSIVSFFIVSVVHTCWIKCVPNLLKIIDPTRKNNNKLINLRRVCTPCFSVLYVS